ncbi:hypothetical protein CEXT_2621 [Caerostris extrusa]|uniref:Uncharacterized protein n=1 Tax=Caerostris extrusa TaxID=172846 RepID=A0AAV4R266_CAEEX|nr:hypothetical protein CEXT_2621 [Caerostris extrusa]
MDVKLYYDLKPPGIKILSVQSNTRSPFPLIPAILYTPSKLRPYFSSEIVVTLQFGKNQSLEREREREKEKKRKRKYRDFTLWRIHPIIPGVPQGKFLHPIPPSLPSRKPRRKNI